MNTIFPFSEIKINAICVTLAQTRKYLMHASEMNGWFLTDPVSRIVYQKPSISMDACAPNAHLCMIVYFYYIHLNYANLCKYINHISGRATRALVENNKKKKQINLRRWCDCDCYSIHFVFMHVNSTPLCCSCYTCDMLNIFSSTISTDSLRCAIHKSQYNAHMHMLMSVHASIYVCM